MLTEEERERLVEHVAEADDDLLERYLEGEELTDQDIKTALKSGVLSRAFVLCWRLTASFDANTNKMTPGTGVPGYGATS